MFCTCCACPRSDTISLAPVPNFSFDAANIYYFGHSQGSNVGTTALATSDRAPAAVLSGAGAFLTSSLLSKTSPVNSAEGLRAIIGDPDFDAAHPVMTIWQTYFDSSDMSTTPPLLLRRPPATLDVQALLMSYGPGDTFSPPGTLRTMAQFRGPATGRGSDRRPQHCHHRSARDSKRQRWRRSASVWRCVQYQPDGYDGHFVAVLDPQAVTDWLAYLMSLIESGAPAVP